VQSLANQQQLSRELKWSSCADRNDAHLLSVKGAVRRLLIRLTCSLVLLVVTQFHQQVLPQQTVTSGQLVLIGFFLLTVENVDF